MHRTLTSFGLPAGPQEVLVVDDDPLVRDLLADTIQSFGHAARLASSVDEALGILRESTIRLVLTDIQMPGKSGVDLLRSVKIFDPNIDIVMVTGVVDVTTAVQSIREGASDYIQKPFNVEEVRIVIERTLEKRRLILENRAYQQLLEEKVQERTQELSAKNQEIEGLYQDLQGSYESTLQALVTALDFRDNETQGHSSRVVEYAVIVATAMGVKEPHLAWIRQGAILHDVGKIGVPDAILKKPGKLDPAEWEEMKRHPEMGYRMLQHIHFLKPALDIVLSHQERWDGSGYPRGLKGEGIPLGARIFAVVDTFDAMTSDRPYRPALTIENARDEVRRFSAIQFDPRVADAFLSIDEGQWCQVRERVHREVLGLEAQVAMALGRVRTPS